MIRTAVPAPTASLGKLARGHRPDDPQHQRRRVRRAPEAVGLNGEAVHGRVVQRGNVERPHDVLGQHLALGLQDRRVLRRQDVEEPENALPGLLDAQHRLVAMSVNVLSHG